MDVPDQKGRLEILKVHARNKKLADEVELQEVAMRTPGFAGADLANLLNEAAILAGRRGLPVREGAGRECGPRGGAGLSEGSGGLPAPLIELAALACALACGSACLR